MRVDGRDTDPTSWIPLIQQIGPRSRQSALWAGGRGQRASPGYLAAVLQRLQKAMLERVQVSQRPLQVAQGVVKAASAPGLPGLFGATPPRLLTQLPGGFQGPPRHLRPGVDAELRGRVRRPRDMGREATSGQKQAGDITLRK